jgi:hypothetical protein
MPEDPKPEEIKKAVPPSTPSGASANKTEKSDEPPTDGMTSKPPSGTLLKVALALASDQFQPRRFISREKKQVPLCRREGFRFERIQVLAERATQFGQCS